MYILLNKNIKKMEMLTYPNFTLLFLLSHKIIYNQRLLVSSRFQKESFQVHQEMEKILHFRNGTENSPAKLLLLQTLQHNLGVLLPYLLYHLHRRHLFQLQYGQFLAVKLGLNFHRHQ